MGLLQANEVIKLVAGIGEPLVGRLLLYESLGTRFTELKVKRDPDCPICGEDAPEIARRGDGQVPRLRALLRRARPRADAQHRLAPARAHPPTNSFPADADREDPAGAAPADRRRGRGERRRAARSARCSSALAESHPDTREQLFAADGELNRYVNVYLNDEDVRVLDGLETAVSDADTVVILPAMAGG